MTWRHGLTGVFLDPPYDDGEMSYASDSDADNAIRRAGQSLSAAVRQWAIENGGHPLLRIALCGYEGEHAMPPTWECVPWKARGGYGGQKRIDGTVNENRHRERIWFSPNCKRPPIR